MMRLLLTKTLYDRRWFVLGWSITMFFMVFIVMTFFPSFSQSGALDKIAETVPPAFKALLGDPDSFHTIRGYLATQLYDIRVPLLLMIMSLVLAQGLAGSEEEKGSLRTLLTTPLSRGRILWERWTAGVVIIGVTIVATVVGAYIGALVIGETVPNDMIWRLAAMSWLFGIAAFTITYAVGTAWGKRGLMMAVGLTVTFGSFIISSFAKSVEWLEPFKYASLLNYYDTTTIKDGAFNTTDVWLLAVLAIIFMLIAQLGFRRRDVS